MRHSKKRRPLKAVLVCNLDKKTVTRLIWAWACGGPSQNHVGDFEWAFQEALGDPAPLAQSSQSPKGRGLSCISLFGLNI